MLAGVDITLTDLWAGRDVIVYCNSLSFLASLCLAGVNPDTIIITFIKIIV